MTSSLAWPQRLLIALSALYFIVFGVLSLAWHADGDDLLIFHAAGGATLQGLNPYTPGRFSDPFSYPPAWVPFCVLLSLMPALVAIWVWKILNLLFLIGAVRLSMNLMFGKREPNPLQRTMIWCYALLLWPTSIALFDGNTPLCVLFFALLGLQLSRHGRPYLAGASLGFSLIKPNVVLPLFALLLAQRKLHLLLSAMIVVASLTFLGAYLTGIGLGDYLAALKVYNAANTATDSSTVGFAKLVQVLSGVGSVQARIAAMGMGILVIVALVVICYRHAWPIRGLEADSALAAFFLLGVGFLGARGYDLVFVIPVFVWLVSLAGNLRWLVWPSLAVAASLMIPQRAIELVYERALSTVLPAKVYDVFLGPFRSWAVLTLILLSVCVFFRLNRDSLSDSVGKGAV
jgi:Glycosyltransferase family 87